MDCTREDFLTIVGNQDYRENEFLDYKQNFSFLEYDKNNPKRAEHIAEFRSDVCAFANANGGYIIYGIQDEKGMAKNIIGIDIPDNNTDKFELDRKNNLNSILPKIPSIKFRFILLDNGKYLVLLFVQHDLFTPYLCLENEKNYHIYRRVGNGKSPMSYSEMKNMFIQSLSLDKEIQNYRQERIMFYKSMEDNEENHYSKFFLMHIIPDTFLDTNYNKNLFMEERNKNIKTNELFSPVNCGNYSIPNVDGLRFTSYNHIEECKLNNNCVAEVFFPLYEYLNIGYMIDKYPYGYLASTAVWDKISETIYNYIEVLKIILDTNRIFVCLAIAGCKNVATGEKVFGNGPCIDRDLIVCAPVVFENINDGNLTENQIKQLHIEYLLALGIKNSKELNSLLLEE